MAGGWGYFKVVATFNHVGRALSLFIATAGGVWVIPSFRIRGYGLHVEHISCVITNCGQCQWAISSLFLIALRALLEKNFTKKLLSLSLDLFFKLCYSRFLSMYYFPSLSYLLNHNLYCFVLSMWGKIMIPMYKLWLQGLYRLHGPGCLLPQKGPLNLITHSLI